MLSENNIDVTNKWINKEVRRINLYKETIPGKSKLYKTKYTKRVKQTSANHSLSRY